MEIILAKQAGFCFGVKRATQMAFEAAGKGDKTFTLGPIIHSPQVVQKLEEMGVKVAGVEIILRMRRMMFEMRKQFDDILEDLARQVRERMNE